jgi:two-component system, NarL family, response regulator NreC
MEVQRLMAKLRIVLADDHAIVRAGLELLINAQADMEVVGHAESGQEAVRQAQDYQPAVVVMDVSMPDLGGVEATVQIKREYPQVRVLALTRHDDQGYLRLLLHAGAAGYVVKKTAADELINAIRIVASGGIYIDPGLAEDLVESLAWPSTSTVSDRSHGQMTEREAAVLRLIAWGRSNKEIAAQLGVSVKTVEYHKANAVNKLGLRSRTDILRYALARGWLRED